MKKIILAACGLLAIAAVQAQNYMGGPLYGSGLIYIGPTFKASSGTLIMDGPGANLYMGGNVTATSHTATSVFLSNGGQANSNGTTYVDAGMGISTFAGSHTLNIGQSGIIAPITVTNTNRSQDLYYLAATFASNPPSNIVGPNTYTYIAQPGYHVTRAFSSPGSASYTVTVPSGTTDMFTNVGGTWTNVASGITGTTASFTLSALTNSTSTNFVPAVVTVTLPLTLTAFNVARNGNAAQLSWSATNQVNFSHFEVEVLGAGNVYTKIATVNGNTTGSYTLTDATSFSKALSGKTNYRLKMVDKDGKYSYSAVRFVTFDGKGGITIYPNPATNYVSVSGLSAKTQLMLVNGAGQQVSSMVTANTTETLDVRTLAKGVYYLRVIKNGEIISTEKVVKQ